ncbi:MAG: GNAT family N-acetyltransferase [Candidatus Caenarcaniphilales bacterium]|nr:GNAT family N-acetyltransferase [Candidatus Caenarcaniphilales bacterium]
MNNSKICIRQAEPKDIKDLVYLSFKLAEYEKFSHQFELTEKAFEKYCFCAKPLFFSLIAENTPEQSEEKKAIGIAIFFYAFSSFTGKPTLYIEDIFVLEEYRGLGIGKKLFTKLIEIAKEKDCARLEWAVLNWNKASIEFYKSLGALPLDDRSTYRLSLNEI